LRIHSLARTSPQAKPVLCKLYSIPPSVEYSNRHSAQAPRNGHQRSGTSCALVAPSRIHPSLSSSIVVHLRFFKYLTQLNCLSPLLTPIPSAPCSIRTNVDVPG